MIRTHYKIQYCNVRQQKIGSHVSLDIIYLFHVQLCDIFIMPFHIVNDNYMFGYISGQYLREIGFKWLAYRYDMKEISACIKN